MRAHIIAFALLAGCRCNDPKAEAGGQSGRGGNGAADSFDRSPTLVAGGDDTCARSADGSWYCWGSDTFGQLGDADSTVACGTPRAPSRCLNRPTPLSGIHDVETLLLEGDMSCALGVDYRLRCWGADYHGGLGRGDRPLDTCPIDAFAGEVGTVDVSKGRIETDRSGLHQVVAKIPCSRTAEEIAGGLDVQQAALGEGFGCVAATDGVYCWGTALDGRLAMPDEKLETCGDIPCLRTPKRLEGIEAVGALVLGTESGAAVRPDGSVLTWGASLAAQLGRSGGAAPAPLAGLPRIVQVALGSYFGCARSVEGQVFCWGSGSVLGSMGLEHVSTDRFGGAEVPSPAEVPGLAGVKALATSPAASHVCALLGGGALVCWGENANGQLGAGDAEAHPKPVVVPGLANVTAVVTGRRHTCALTGEGAIYCWGADEDGQLGEAPSSRCKHSTLAEDSTIPCALTPVRVTIP